MIERISRLVVSTAASGTFGDVVDNLQDTRGKAD
jgi:hypothetical protein